MNLAEDPRAGLELVRYHSWRVLHSQSNGEHSAQIMRILLTVWPDCPRRMLVHAVTHDIGEMAGDIQYPFKKIVPGLKECMDACEEHVKSGMRVAIGMPPHVTLSQYELDVFKLCEFIDMWEYGLREQNLGNRYGQVIAQRCIMGASTYFDIVEESRGEHPDIRPAVKSYMDRRLAWEQDHD